MLLPGGAAKQWVILTEPRRLSRSEAKTAEGNDPEPPVSAELTGDFFRPML